MNMAGASLSSIKKQLAKVSDLVSGAGSNTAVGVSIGSSSIKLAELKKVGKTWKLVHFGVVQLPEGAVENREIVNSIAVIESLKTLLSQIKLRNKSVCTSLSGSSLIIKRMPLQVPNLKELPDQVFWEAEQYIPFDIAEVALDYHILSRAKDSQTDILLTAVKKSVLEGYVHCCEEAGLKAKIVDVDFFALQHLWENNYPGAGGSEAVALVDIGASSMKLSVVHGKIPVFTKDTNLGGRNLTAEIERNMQLSYSDAEALKLSAQSGTVPQEMNDLMQIMCENFAMEIKKSLDFYHASSIGAPVSSILIAGGSAKIPNLSAVIEERNGVPTQQFDPFLGVGYDATVFTPDYLQSISTLSVIPIGLAIRAGTR